MRPWSILDEISDIGNAFEGSVALFPSHLVDLVDAGASTDILTIQRRFSTPSHPPM